MKEKLTNAYLYVYNLLVKLISAVVICLVVYTGYNLVAKFVNLPSISWWSASLFSDYKVDSIVTEVAAPGYNIRKVQSIDAFGKLCTDTFATIGMATSCEYPPEERKNWTIEDYRKLAKANNN